MCSMCVYVHTYRMCVYTHATHSDTSNTVCMCVCVLDVCTHVLEVCTYVYVECVCMYTYTHTHLSFTCAPSLFHVCTYVNVECVCMTPVSPPERRQSLLIVGIRKRPIKETYKAKETCRAPERRPSGAHSAVAASVGAAHNAAS